jgi:hypothetical protein
MPFCSWQIGSQRYYKQSAGLDEYSRTLDNNRRENTNLNIMASFPLRKTALTFGAIIICLMMMASLTDANPISGNATGIEQENKVPAASRANQTITSNTIPETCPSYSTDVMKILGIVRGTLPKATDTEIIIMLLLWIWGFSILTVIMIFVMCCCHTTKCC